MERRIWLFTIPVALLSLSGGAAAQSGTKNFVNNDANIVVDVTITVGASETTAEGALGTARSESISGDDEEKWIGCWVDAAPTGTMATCVARTWSGGNARCTSIDPFVIGALNSMNPDSKLTFKFSNAGSTCTHIRVENISYYTVKSL